MVNSSPHCYNRITNCNPGIIMDVNPQRVVEAIKHNPHYLVYFMRQAASIGVT